MLIQLKPLLLSYLLLTTLICKAQDTLTLKNYVGNLKTIEIIIEKKPYQFLFDTGGGDTMVSTELANQLDLPKLKNIWSLRMHGDSVQIFKSKKIDIQIGGHLFSIDEIGIFDFSSVIPKEFPKIDGVLSLKTFNQHYFSLSLSNNTIILYSKSDFKTKTKKLKSIGIKINKGISGEELDILIPLFFGNKKVWVLFDSGNLANTILNRKFEAGNHVLRLNSIELQNPIEFKEIIYDGVLSFSMIKDFQVFINLKNNKVFFAPIRE